MNRPFSNRFRPISTLACVLSVAGALAATALTGLFIDALAQGDGAESPIVAKRVPSVTIAMHTDGAPVSR